MENLGLNKSIKIAIAMLVLYLMHFTVFPKLFAKYYSVSNECIALYWISSIIFYTFLICSVQQKILDWVMGDFVYVIMTAIYTANGAYGFVISKFHRLAPIVLGIIVEFFILIIVQGIITILIKMLKKLRRTKS